MTVFFFSSCLFLGDCLVLVAGAVLPLVSWNMSVGWTWCACFISSVCVATTS